VCSRAKRPGPDRKEAGDIPKPRDGFTSALSSLPGGADGQTIASLAAPRGQHPAPARRLHAGTEAVRLEAMADIGLIGAFGHDSPKTVARPGAFPKPRDESKAQYKRASPAASSLPAARKPEASRSFAPRGKFFSRARPERAWKTFGSCDIVRGVWGRKVQARIPFLGFYRRGLEVFHTANGSVHCAA